MKNIFLLVATLSVATSFAQKVVKEYHDNGALKSIGKQYTAKELDFKNKEMNKLYQDNSWLHPKPEKVGIWKWYYDNGQLKTKGFYSERKTSEGEIYGIEDKKWENYHSNGKLKSTGNYRSGHKDGVWTSYYKHVGDVYSIGSYKVDRKVGEWKTYYNNGKLMNKGDYKNNQKNGDWEYYYNTGKLKEKGFYLNGNKDGEVKVYYKNGQLSVIRTFSNGIRIGEAKWYHENGKLKTIGHYSNDLQVGEWKRYHANGSLNNVEKFHNINTKASSISDVLLRGVSTYNKNSIKETRVDLKFLKVQYSSTIHPPESSLAFYLKDDKGRTYKLIGQEGWPGDGADDFGYLSKSRKNLLVSLKFENVPIHEIKTLDLIEGDCTRNCWHIANLLSENRTIIYASDECVSGNCENGNGIYKWSTGDKYSGEFKRGKRHGKGTQTSSSGRKYIGEFDDDKMFGWGVLLLENGDKIDGRFINNDLHYGTYVSKSGYKAKGFWENGKLNGNAVINYSNGEIYKGEVKDGVEHGFGVLTWSDNSQYIGLFKNSNFHGDGIYYPFSGDIYKGKYEEGERVGGATYSTSSEKKIVIDKYFNSEIQEKYNSNEKREKKEELFKGIVSLIKKGSNLEEQKWIIESIDYKEFQIVFSEKADGWETLYFLDFNTVNKLEVDYFGDGKIKTSIRFNNGIVKSLNELAVNEIDEKVRDSLETFDVYFINNVFDVIEFNNVIEKYKKLL